MTNRMLDSESVTRQWALFIEAAHETRENAYWSWRFDGARHHFVPNAEPIGDMLVVSAYRDVNFDLERRLLVAAAWPGPAGVVRRWPAWRRERIEALSRYCATARATAIVDELIDAANQGNIDGVVQAVAHYERAVVEVCDAREQFSKLSSMWVAEAEQEDSRR